MIELVRRLFQGLCLPIMTALVLVSAIGLTCGPCILFGGAISREIDVTIGGGALFLSAFLAIGMLQGQIALMRRYGLPLPGDESRLLPRKKPRPQPEIRVSPLSKAPIRVGPAKRCPYCHDDLNQTGSRTRCPDCRAVYHLACSREIQGCTTLGCVQARRVPC